MDRGYDYCVFPWIDDKSGDTSFYSFDLVGNAACLGYAVYWEYYGDNRFEKIGREDLDG